MTYRDLSTNHLDSKTVSTVSLQRVPSFNDWSLKISSPFIRKPFSNVSNIIRWTYVIFIQLQDNIKRFQPFCQKGFNVFAATYLKW